jgi:methionyl-tRNA formyltransferase
MRICYVTCGQNGFYCLKRMLEEGVEIAAVVTIPPEAGQRYMVSGYADVEPWCHEQGIPVVSLADYALRLEHMRGMQFDLIVVNGWNRLLSAEIIAASPYGGLGIHAGHPPIGHGRAPLVWNILLGRDDLEVYVFRLTAKADDGDILALRVLEITPWDDVATLYEKVMWAAVGLFRDAIACVGAGTQGSRQALASARAYPKRTPMDGLIDFSRSERELHDFVRAQARPYPGAFSYLQGQKWHIWRAEPFDRFAFRDVAREPGRILAALPSGLVVQTGGSPLWIREAEVDGSTVVPYPEGAGERLVGHRFTSE